LSIVVPLVFIFIFILLYLSFQIIIQSILIFTAIPLSTKSGVFVLWLHSRSFSVLVGIGFIARCGVAVLNGIVLVAYFNQLKTARMTNVVERNKKRKRVRLRSVITAAAVASLGFLPVALSNNAAEAAVQKPLATVLIGRLITATLFTLIVWPILYYYSAVKLRLGLSSSKTPTSKFVAKPLSILFFLGMMLNIVQAKNKTTLNPNKPISTVEQAIDAALKNHPKIKLGNLQIEQQKQLKDAAYVLPKMSISGAYGQFNSNTFDQSYAISQSFNPFLAKIKKGLAAGYLQKSELELAMAESELKHHIKTLWDQAAYHSALNQLLEEKENLYKQFTRFANEAFQKGETGSLEKHSATLVYQNVMMEQKNALAESENIIAKLEALIVGNVEMEAVNYEAQNLKENLQAITIAQHPQLKILLKEIEIAQNKTKVSNAERKPDFTIGYQVQSFRGILEIDEEEVEFDRIPRFHGFELGIEIPVFGKGYKALNKANKINELLKEEEVKLLKIEIDNHLKTLQNQFTLQKENVGFYTNTALPNAQQIKEEAIEAYQTGALDFNDYLENVNLYFETMENYLAAVQSFNQLVFEVAYLVGE